MTAIVDDPKFAAGVALLGRTGATAFRIGYSDEADGEPIVWYAVATFTHGAEAAGALDPHTALMRLCAQLIDGGLCTHCGQHTIFEDNPTDTPLDDLLDALGCVYAWDPELGVFRRGCEGEYTTEQPADAVADLWNVEDIQDCPMCEPGEYVCRAHRPTESADDFTSQWGTGPTYCRLEDL